jgi:peptidyl-prolyl cis-trans isomerase A (cyclophilin A)
MKLNQKVGAFLATAAFVLTGTLNVSPVRADDAKATTTPAADPVVLISTSMGKIKVRLDSAKAPISVANFLDYVKAKHYDGTIFHRVIPQFMIQGGGMTKDLKMKPATVSRMMKAPSQWLARMLSTAPLISFLLT